MSIITQEISDIVPTAGTVSLGDSVIIDIMPITSDKALK